MRKEGKEPLFCGVDIGTSSTKIALFSSEGRMLYRSAAASDSHAVQSQQIWATFLRAWNTVPNIWKKEIQALCFVGHGPTIVPLISEQEDKGSESPVMGWWANPPADLLAWAHSRGFDPQIAPVMAKLVAWKNQSGSAPSKPIALLQPTDFLAYRCTGIVANSSFPVPGFLPWSPEALDTMGLKDWFTAPRCIPAGEVIGGISKPALEELGLRKDAVVVSGCPDFAAALLGTATIEDGLLCDRGGSSQGVTLCCKKRIQPPGLVATPFFIPGYWKISGMMNTTGSALQWFCAQVASIPIDGLDALLFDQNRPSPILFIPYLSGERSPHWDPEASGGFLGLRMEDTPQRMALSIMETVGYQIRQIVRLMEGAGGVVREIRSTGGQARSDLWNQIKADVLGRPVVVGTSPESELLGAAILAIAGFSESDPFTLSQTFYAPAKTFIPNQSLHKRYNTLFHEFSLLYPEQKNRFERLARFRKSQ
jgi:xylulokinase